MQYSDFSFVFSMYIYLSLFQCGEPDFNGFHFCNVNVYMKSYCIQMFTWSLIVYILFNIENNYNLAMLCSWDNHWKKSRRNVKQFVYRFCTQFQGMPKIDCEKMAKMANLMLKVAELYKKWDMYNITGIGQFYTKLYMWHIDANKWQHIK